MKVEWIDAASVLSFCRSAALGGGEQPLRVRRRPLDQRGHARQRLGRSASSGSMIVGRTISMILSRSV